MKNNFRGLELWYGVNIMVRKNQNGNTLPSEPLLCGNWCLTPKPFWRVLWNISKKQKGKHFITYWLPFFIGQARVYMPTHLGSMCVDAEQFPMVFAHKGCAGLKICVTPNLVKPYPKLVTVAIGRVRGGAKTTSWWAKEVSNILLPPHCQVGYIQGQYNIMSHFIELLHQAARLLILAKTSAVCSTLLTCIKG